MRSFAYKAKLEVLKQEIDNDCCSIAFLSAVIKSSGQLNINDKKFVVEIFTEIEELFEKINAVIKQYPAIIAYISNNMFGMYP